MIRTFLPIHLIPYGARIIVYGAGKTGRLYCLENEKIGWCRVVCAIDRNYKNIRDFPVAVDGLESINKYSFDYVLIARVSLAGKLEIDSIISDLIRQGVDSDRILADPTCCIWSNIDNNVVDDSVNDSINEGLLKVAFLPSGAMGDNIISLRLYREIASLMKNGTIDVFSKGDYADAVFYHQPLLGNVYHDIFDKESKEWKKYDLVIRSEFEPIIQYMRINRITVLAPDFAERLRRLFDYQTQNNSEMPVGVYSSGIRLNRARFWKLNRYTLLGCNGIFNIKDQYVEVYTKESKLEEFHKLKLEKNYITFCYGAGGSHDGRTQQTKVWPKENYEQWISLMKRQYPEIELVQIGAEGTERISGADKCFFGKPIEVVKYILKYALLHLDCDSGLSHLATQLGTKCIVLFGPTPAWFLGYDRNINICSRKCRECKDLIADWYFRCINYAEPICMKSIGAKTVYNKTCDYLEKTYE